MDYKAYFWEFVLDFLWFIFGFFKNTNSGYNFFKAKILLIIALLESIKKYHNGNRKKYFL